MNSGRKMLWGRKSFRSEREVKDQIRQSSTTVKSCRRGQESALLKGNQKKKKWAGWGTGKMGAQEDPAGGMAA